MQIHPQKVPSMSADGELYWHVHKKSNKNQNEDGDHKLLRHQYLLGRKPESVGNKL
jgi:hypothetical protein